MEQHETVLRSTSLTRQEIALEIWKCWIDRLWPENLEAAIAKYNQVFDQLDERVT